MKLIIIESPGKIKKFKQCLGKGYEILSSFGHCVDLPAKGFSINIKKDFEPSWGINPDKKEVMNTLIKAAKKADVIYLMSDSDREGEAISWHLKTFLAPTTKAKFYRASTNEVTETGIKKALANPGDIDMQMIDAYLCRRLLDRCVGYKTSFLTKQATGGKSAGRVQSALLRILTEREKEIIHFVPVEYWVLTADFLTKEGELYSGTLDDRIEVPDEKTAIDIYQKVHNGNPVVTSVQSKEASISPYAPFTTSALIQSASSIFGWTAKKTMQVAQGLYESGHCTYHRTDSPMMAQEALINVRGFISHQYGVNYLHSTQRIYSAKKGAQEGHECCRPTEVSVQSVSMAPDHKKLYSMVWRRAIASQMSSGKDRRVKVLTKSGGYNFVSRGNVRLFDGFRKIWDYTKHEDVLLPNLKESQKVVLKNK